MIKFINKKRRLIERRKNHLLPILHLLNLSKENLVKNFQKNGNLSQIIHKIKLYDILIVQIYVDDIIFGATNVSLCE